MVGLPIALTLLTDPISYTRSKVQLCSKQPAYKQALARLVSDYLSDAETSTHSPFSHQSLTYLPRSSYIAHLLSSFFFHLPSLVLIVLPMQCPQLLRTLLACRARNFSHSAVSISVLYTCRVGMDSTVYLRSD